MRFLWQATSVSMMKGWIELKKKIPLEVSLSEINGICDFLVHLAMKCVGDHFSKYIIGSGEELFDNDM